MLFLPTRKSRLFMVSLLRLKLWSGMILTNKYSQLGNMVIVHYRLSQVNEFHVHDDWVITLSPVKLSKRLNERSNHVHRPSLPDLRAVPRPRNHLSWNNLCTLCLLLWRTDEVDRGSAYTAKLHGHAITATKCFEPIPSRGRTLVTSQTPSPCHVSRTAHDVVHFRTTFFL